MSGPCHTIIVEKILTQYQIANKIVHSKVQYILKNQTTLKEAKPIEWEAMYLIKSARPPTEIASYNQRFNLFNSIQDHEDICAKITHTNHNNSSEVAVRAAIKGVCWRTIIKCCA